MKKRKPTTQTKATPRAQLNKYLDDISTITMPSNIFDFWKNKADEFPALYKLANYVLCIPATSAPVERIFSTSGLIM